MGLLLKQQEYNKNDRKYCGLDKGRFLAEVV